MNSNKSKIHLKVTLITGDLTKSISNKEVKKIPIQESYEDMVDKCLAFFEVESFNGFSFYYYDDQDKMYIEREEEYKIFYDAVISGENKALSLIICKHGVNVDLGKSFQLNNTSINISQESKIKESKNDNLFNKDNDDNANIKDELKKENSRYKSNSHNNDINANNDFLNDDKINQNKNDISGDHHDNISTISKYSEPNQINKVGGDIVVANSQDFSINNPIQDSKVAKEYSFNPNHNDEEDFCLIKDDKNSENLDKVKKQGELPKSELENEKEINEKSRILENELQKLKKEREAELKKKALADMIKKNRLNNILLSSTHNINNVLDKNDSKENKQNNDVIVNINKEGSSKENIENQNNSKNDVINKVNNSSDLNLNSDNNQVKFNHKINVSFDNNNYLGIRDFHSLITSEVSNIVNFEVEKFKADLNLKINSKISLIVNHFYTELSQKVRQSSSSEKSYKALNNTNDNNCNKKLENNNKNINNEKIINNTNVNYQSNMNVNNQFNNDVSINNKGNSYNLLPNNSLKFFNINDLNKKEMENIFNLKESVVSRQRETFIYLLFQNNSKLTINLSVFNLFFCSNTEDLREFQYQIEMENKKMMLGSNEQFGVYVKMPNENINLGRFKVYFETNKGIKSDFFFLEIPIVRYKITNLDYNNLFQLSELTPGKSLYDIAVAYFENDKDADKAAIYLVNQLK